MQQVTSTSSMINNYRTEDPRSPLQKLNRRQLRAFCQHHNIAFRISQPATALREAVAGAGLTGTEPYTYPAPREATEFIDRPQGMSVRDVSSMSPPQLRKICRERGITTLPNGDPITNKAKKVDLLEALLQKPLVSQERVDMSFVDG